MRSEPARLSIQLIRSYDYFKEAADDLLALGVGIQVDGQPKGTGVGDPTARTAEQRERYLDEVRVVDEALKAVPEEYRDIVLRWVKDGQPLDLIPGSEYADRHTWQNHKRELITEVARIKGWL